ncbi:MAG: hypothetical protein RBU21_05985 [FCB group bacterium]|jgi:hypothetical protein|nr:hypothetical protein [FCB group bacterium]
MKKTLEEVRGLLDSIERLRGEEAVLETLLRRMSKPGAVVDITCGGVMFRALDGDVSSLRVAVGQLFEVRKTQVSQRCSELGVSGAGLVEIEPE